MAKATEELLKDHKMIRKILSDWNVQDPRFVHTHKTLTRVVLGHAWFEDQIFFPAVEAEPAIAKRFMDEMVQEHKDIDTLLKLVRKTSTENKENLEYYVMQLRAILEAHFRKEEDALFPICEKILTEEGLVNLGVEMRRRQTEIQKFATIE